MQIVSRLTLPAVAIGLAAIIGSGLFVAPAKAQGYPAQTMAQITGVASWDHLNVRRWPASYSRKVGELSPGLVVWVERCIQFEETSDWCLVQRGPLEGWVNARYLTAEPGL